jgi:hypothetical protein
MIPRESITITRQSKGEWVDGVFVPGGTYDFTIQGIIQPLGPRDVERLPEAARTVARFSLYADTDQEVLELTDLDKPAAADRVTWHGRSYGLVALGEWAHFGGTASHREYALVEVGAEEDDE